MDTEIFTDLFVLVADSQIQRTVKTLLTYRRAALNIRKISYEVQRHPRQDPGCRTQSVALVETTRSSHGKAIVVFDFEGCGENRLDAHELEDRLEQKLQGRGWAPDRVAYIVIDSELEAWAFGAAPGHLRRAVGWTGTETIQEWLVSDGHWALDTPKPQNPKAALESLLLRSHRTRSARLYEELARNVNLTRCQDRAFQKFRATLQRWFPAQ
jgi:hypothetical protein